MVDNTKTTTEYFARIEKEDRKIIEDNFTYSEPVFGKGRISCRHCDHTYTWSEWGRSMNQALTVAGKHIARKHDIGKFNFCSPITMRENFHDWAMEKSNEIEVAYIKSQPIHKVGDKIIIRGEEGKTAIITEVIDKDHKNSFLIGKNETVNYIAQRKDDFGDGKVCLGQVNTKIFEEKN